MVPMPPECLAAQSARLGQPTTQCKLPQYAVQCPKGAAFLSREARSSSLRFGRSPSPRANSDRTATAVAALSAEFELDRRATVPRLTYACQRQSSLWFAAAGWLVELMQKES
jgi:hypothetical protein